MRLTKWHTLSIMFLILVSGGLVGSAQPTRIRYLDSSAIDRVGSLTDNERGSLAKGEIVVKALKSTDKKEISILGVVRLDRHSLLSLAEFRDSFSQRSNESIISSGRFSVPPSELDLKSLRMEKDDLRDLRKCKPGNCKLLVPDALMEKLALGSVTSSDDADLEELYKKHLVDLTRDFEQRGIGAMTRFDGSKRSPPLAEQHKALIEKASILQTFTPALASYLRAFPDVPIAGVESRFDWTKVKFGLKPIVTITHVISHQSEDEGTMTIVTRQIYASRYINGSIAVSMIIRESGGAIYLIFANTSRSDALGGLFSGIKRSMATSEGINKVRDLIGTAQTRLENSAPEKTPNQATGESEAITGISEPFQWPALATVAAVVIFVLLGMRSFSRWKKRYR